MHRVHRTMPPALTLALPLVIILVALNLRPILASVGPLLSAIQQDIELSFSVASLLTMLPVLAMGAATFAGFKVARRIGMNAVIGYSLILLAVATAMRFFVSGASLLIASALVAGLGIAMIQAVMPAIIKAHFGARTPLMMGFYVTAIMGGAAFAAAGSPFIAEQAGWRAGLGHWVWLAIAALGCWIWIANKLKVPKASGEEAPNTRFWQNSRAWELAIFFGLATGAYVCVLAWLAPYAVEQGYSDQQAGLLLGFLTSMEVLSGLISPILATRTADRRLVMIVLCLLQVVGFSGLALSPETGLWLWAGMMGLGIGGLFPLSLIVTMDHQDDPVQAGKLTAFVQAIGYLVAGVTPWLAGVIRDSLNSFDTAWLLLAGCCAVCLVQAVRFSPVSYRKAFPVAMAAA